jgi:hypothetical protein
MKNTKTSEFGVMNEGRPTLYVARLDPYADAPESNYEKHELESADFSTPKLLLEAADRCELLWECLTSFYASRKTPMQRLEAGLPSRSIESGRYLITGFSL